MAEISTGRGPASLPKTGITVALLWAYFSAVFLVGKPALNMGLGLWLTSVLAAFAAGSVLARVVAGRSARSRDLLANLNLLGGTVVACLVALDIAYSMYVNSTTSSFDITKSRVFDENIWVSELYPKVYYPTERNFALHKPNVKVSGEPFGNFYSLPMLDSPILTSAVLERSGVTIRINEAGFRESSDIGAAEIFTLGDSFTFGWGVNEEESWPGRLEARLERTIYNLGIHDASPRQEVELLRYVLRRYAEGLRLSTVLWMIYEGNDLEDDYSDVVQRPDMSGTIPLSRGTLVEALERMMWTIKRQSVIHRFQRGQITWRPPSGDGADPYVVDGVRLVYPLYHSERLGPRLFSGTYVDLAGKSADYVDGHWNRSALESVFRDMKALADEHGFDVVVITAPTASRLHGPYFDNFPRISERPYFLDFVRELADSAGFPAIDLYASMKPLAGEELFYFRDDDHFNRRGNAVAAELIAEELLAAER